MSFKIGQEVFVVADKCSHGFSIGSRVKVMKKHPSSGLLDPKVKGAWRVIGQRKGYTGEAWAYGTDLRAANNPGVDCVF